MANPWQFASGHYDANRWYKFGERYFSVRIGRWSQLDPKEQPTDPVQEDRYAYAGDDPINTTDPAGTCFVFDCNVYHDVGYAADAVHWLAEGYVVGGLGVAASGICYAGASEAPPIGQVAGYPACTTLLVGSLTVAGFSVEQGINDLSRIH